MTMLLLRGARSAALLSRGAHCYSSSISRINSASNYRAVASLLHWNQNKASPSSCLFSTATSIPDPPSSNHFHKPLADAKGSVIYTETDEAPALATYSLYPVISKVQTNIFIFVQT